MAGLSAFACVDCEHRQPKWFAQCPACRSYKAPIEEPMTRTPSGQFAGFGAPRPVPLARALGVDDETVAPSKASDVIAERSKPIPITDVPEESYQRIPSGIEPLDRVLGGGLVAASMILITGDPGAGKSSLMGQALAAFNLPGLYATGEESRAQVTMRMRRLDAAHERIMLVAENDVDVVIEHAREMRARGPMILLVDSMQTLITSALGSVAGSVSQIRECIVRLVNFGKREDTPVIIIGHVTKDGGAAGPKALEHLVDVVLHLANGNAEDGMGHLRFLSATKNRFGPTITDGALVVGSFTMTERGLEPCDATPEPMSREERDGELMPLAQELLNRYIASGGAVDGGLRDRIAGRLDLEMWRETRYDAPVTPHDPPEGLA